MRTMASLSIGVALIGLMAFGKEGKVVRERTARVKNDGQTLRAVVLSVKMPKSADVKGAKIFGEDGKAYPAQIVSLPNSQAKVTWLEPELPARTERTYRVLLTEEPSPPTVVLTKESRWVTVTVKGQPFTRYYFSDVPKPFCFPLVGPNGKVLTRGFPVEPREGETKDHPHHKGFWVAHGDVNGHDFWSERNGRIVHKEFEALESGSVFGLLRARHDWSAADGKKLCEAVQELRFYALPKMRILDLTQTFIATESEVTFGDTKEGFVAIRIPDELTLTRGTGHILNATGHKDHEAWGKRASWCLYYGTVESQPVAIGFFDHPKNPSYPTPWHVRDYGLFANGPFGRKDFHLPQEEPVRISKGDRLTLRYRIVLIEGHPTVQEMEELWAGFARQLDL